MTNNNIVEGSLNSNFHPVVQVCVLTGSDVEEVLMGSSIRALEMVLTWRDYFLQLEMR